MEIDNELKAATLVIFGITGDLAQRKLLPALYHLQKYGLLPEYYKIVGVSRRDVRVDEMLKDVGKAIAAATHQPADPDVLRALGAHITLEQMDLTESADYSRLRERLDAIETEAGVCMTRLFYMAVPFQALPQIVTHLGENNLHRGCNHDPHAGNRLLAEKPFGDNLASAQALVGSLERYFGESQLYRIDHYLAKETAQNLLTFRFENPLFRAVWDRAHIKGVMLTAAEAIGIEGRSVFYEQTGALRDFVQNHLLQLLALTTMEEPETMTAAAIHREKLALLEAIAPIAPNEVAAKTVRGQYQGYRNEVENAGSQTETYAAVQLAIDNERWRGVPILLRTGKALSEKVVEITLLFEDRGARRAQQNVNTLTIRIQPNEGIVLGLRAKKPGFHQTTEHVQMEFCYSRSFAGVQATPDAYERVLVDALRGDKTLFASSDEVLTSWRIIEHVLDEWAKDAGSLHIYPQNTWGPAAAEQLARAVGLTWMTDLLKVCPA